MKLKRLTGHLGRIWHRWPVADVPSFWQRTSFLSSASTWTAWSRPTRKPSALHLQQPRGLSRTALGLGFESFQEETLGQRSWGPVGLWKGQNFPFSWRSLCSAGMLTYTELLLLLTFSTIGNALCSSCYCRVLKHIKTNWCVLEGHPRSGGGVDRIMRTASLDFWIKWRVRGPPKESPWQRRKSYTKKRFSPTDNRK